MKSSTGLGLLSKDILSAGLILFLLDLLLNAAFTLFIAPVTPAAVIAAAPAPARTL
jgi:hypothetical protein